MIKDIFYDKENALVIGQRPNLPLILWFTTKIGQFFATGAVESWLKYTSASILIIWALMEIFQGVNTFRKLLGLFVVIITSLSLIK